MSMYIYVHTSVFVEIARGPMFSMCMVSHIYIYYIYTHTYSCVHICCESVYIYV